MDVVKLKETMINVEKKGPTSGSLASTPTLIIPLLKALLYLKKVYKNPNTIQNPTIKMSKK